MTNEEKVRHFMRKAEQDVPSRPTLPSSQIAFLRMELIGEEYQELAHAIATNNLEQIADSVADLLYVTYGLGIACGLPVQTVFDEVHRSNMTKFIDGHKRHDGKWIKGPSWSPPDIKTILANACPKPISH